MVFFENNLGILAQVFLRLDRRIQEIKAFWNLCSSQRETEVSA
jgi:hypothetical protein